MKTRIVAEIGCNHNGDINIAREMVLSAFNCGASAVKFQLFSSEKLVSPYAKKADYQIRNTHSDESQIQMLKKLELNHAEYLQLKEYAETLGIEIFATAFDEDSVLFLESVGQNIWKIPSGEITNLPLLERIRDIRCTEKEIILSTGMSTMDEIHTAVNCLAGSLDTKFTILHCNTDYPTVDEDMNIRAMVRLAEEFPDWGFGLSDHSLGTVASIIAVALGASFIEKHFTLDKTLPGPDQAASISPEELHLLCKDVRRAEVMLGSYEKYVTASEIKNKNAARKSIVAKKRINKGDIFTEDNITCKRPGNGISPVYWHRVIGLSAEKNFAPDELITCSEYAWEEYDE